jgi:hypothetical protein
MKPLILFPLAVMAATLFNSTPATADEVVHGARGTAVHTGRGTAVHTHHGTAVHTGGGTYVHGHGGTAVHTNYNWDNAYWHGNKYGYWNGHRGYWHVVNGDHIFVIVEP